MTKTNVTNIINESYERMIKHSEKFAKDAPKKITNEMVTKTLENLLKGIK